jgi:hypothetical protein
MSLQFPDDFFGCKLGIRLGHGIIRRHEAGCVLPQMKSPECEYGVICFSTLSTGQIGLNFHDVCTCECDGKLAPKFQNSRFKCLAHRYRVPVEREGGMECNAYRRPLPHERGRVMNPARSLLISMLSRLGFGKIEIENSLKRQRRRGIRRV